MSGDAGLERELKRTRPFRTPAQEALVAILRTAHELRRFLASVVEEHGITLQQYNVLRILRGAHPEPLPTLEIAERMIEPTPGVTRLTDRLAARELLSRERSAEDRRIVHCRIAESGLALLAGMDEAVNAADEASVAGLGPGQVRQLIRLLDGVRDGLP